MKTYLEYAETLKTEGSDVIEIAKKIQAYINKNLVSEVYHPCSILESRFTPGEIAFALKMRSCGAVTNIASEMLRHIGYKVKKVHGTTPASPDHAWIKVEDSNKKWVSLDLSQEEMTDLKSHVEIADCAEWEEINDILLKTHLRFISESID
ncbi:hypothetical protein A3K01_01640 [candidate division WWE3 bacterium RIFOXYD1_FULL_43_17]|uniref:Transglutaminase-like domain-containing protein n=1 Tax=candidate division WWE3 bacterium RIFOXYD1_FULL_43_17 TaxID=1802652 RepID=A0A1F4XFU0_UNCKA|nr:MAG: hypothetical protein A3K01_01640 [candidate division WWE3 bacterium RIFOXYD1_FULL_43_17]